MKEFNITGLCIPSEHYMVDIKEKIDKIEELIEKKKYFTINRARQYGKTTTLSEIYRKFKEQYLIITITFEGMGDASFSSEAVFIKSFIRQVGLRLQQCEVEEDIQKEWNDLEEKPLTMEDLSHKITRLVEENPKDIILMIDEVDKSSNNQLFLHFIGLLRSKYLNRGIGLDKTFRSVILAGVYDVKNLKLKLRPDEEKKYNSPWNIAVDYKVDMSFSPNEIASMLLAYERDYATGMDIEAISKELYRYTGGYPFLVSKLCKTIDEELDKNWTKEGLMEAVKLLLIEKNTLFDDVFKNLENDHELYNLIFKILIEGMYFEYSHYNPTIEKASVLGVIKEESRKVIISNQIFETIIYNYMLSKRATSGESMNPYKYESKFINEGKLDMALVLDKFQEIMHDEYRDKDEKFIEREGRLLFLCFLKPIINGAGFYYVEAETRGSNRMDIVVTYGEAQHIVELKIWHGENYEQNALEQLSGYLESKREERGYLISFSFNKNKVYSKEWRSYNDKSIYAIVV